MSWSDLHSQSEQLAEAAHLAGVAGDAQRATELFSQAARAEASALLELSSDKPRTYGITAVSAVALWYKAGELNEAEHLAHTAAAVSFLPPFAADQLRSLLQSIWNELVQREAGISFAPGQVLVSVRGGHVVRGGAPLDLIVEKAQAVQSLFYRTVEYLRDLPLRKKGPPSRDLQERCRPWLFQSVPGSYQFSVAIQKPQQPDLFGDPFPEPSVLTDTFLSILRAASEAPEDGLKAVVTKEDYRVTFLKMARNLSPSGKMFTQLDIQGAGDRKPVVFSQETRTLISSAIRGPDKPPSDQPDDEEITLKGVLRALDLDDDWLEISTDGTHRKITGVGETVDDVIGPMVNHDVIVRVRPGKRKTLTFIDIERDE
jgi:hypothetical protein